MKKHLRILSILLIFTILLAGCGFGFEEEKEPREQLDPAEWPTPKTTPPPASPTPFPKTTLAPTAIPVAPATATPLAMGDLSFSGNMADLADQVTALSGGLPPVGAAFITVDGSTIRQGPGPSYEALDTLTQGEVTGILGQDSSGEWLYVITTSLVQGWLPFDTVNVAGGLADAPVLPPDHLTTATNQAASLPVDDLTNITAGTPLSILSGGLSPVAAALVMADSATIRQRPGASSAAAAAVEQGELAGIFGRDASGDWLYLVTITGKQGWLPLDTLRVTGTLAEAPVLPPDPVAAFINQAVSSAGGSAGEAAARQPIDVADLEPVATARVDSAILNIRQRPGASYKLLDTLSQDEEVVVLALNRDKEWALVKTANAKIGWVSLDFLGVAGSLASAPQVQTLTPDENHPPDQAAPIVALSGSSEAVAATGSSSSSGGGGNVTPASASTTTAATQSSDPSLPNNTLAPITTARVNRKVELRRGPGTSYGALDTLTVDEIVSVRALNEARDWAVVQTSLSKAGWLPLDSLTAEGSLASAPQVLTAWVNSNELEIRRGPAIYYEPVGTLAINTLVSVIALNEGRSWALVEPMAGGQGWISLRLLDVMGSVANVPQVPAPPLAESSPTDQLASPSNQDRPPRGQLVFQTSSGGDIMIVNAGGTSLRRLANGIDPVLSPDGQTVAFTRWAGDVGTLWTINVDGSGERAVLGETRKAKGPDWSPDGSQIVLNFQHGGRLDELRRCKELGPGSSPKIPRNAGRFRVSVNEKGKPELCFTIPPDPHWSLRLVDVAEGSFEDLYGGLYAFRPAWDPGQPWRIVSDAGNGLLAVDVNRDDYRQNLTDIIGDSSPVFSPDGRYLAVVTKEQNSHNIYRLNADGSGRVRLTDTPLWVPVQPDSSGKLWNHVAPTWSPDGSQIAFLTDRTGRWEIWIMNIDGSNQRPMFPEEINDQLDLSYDFVDERALSWR